MQQVTAYSASSTTLSSYCYAHNKPLCQCLSWTEWSQIVSSSMNLFLTLSTKSSSFVSVYCRLQSVTSSLCHELVANKWSSSQWSYQDVWTVVDVYKHGKQWEPQNGWLLVAVLQTLELFTVPNLKFFYCIKLIKPLNMIKHLFEHEPIGISIWHFQAWNLPYVTRYQHNMHMFHTFIRKELDGSGRYIVVKKAIWSDGSEMYTIGQTARLKWRV